MVLQTKTFETILPLVFLIITARRQLAIMSSFWKSEGHYSWTLLSRLSVIWPIRITKYPDNWISIEKKVTSKPNTHMLRTVHNYIQSRVK